MLHPEAVVSLGADLSTGGVAHATQTPTVVKSSLRLGGGRRSVGLAGCRLGRDQARGALAWYLSSSRSS